DESCDKPPKAFFVTLGVLGALAIIPMLMVGKMRVTNSSSPRFHIFFDMDFSPAKDAQLGSTLFADGRAMRLDVPGTVARGQMTDDPNFLTGIDVEKLALIDEPRAERLVRILQDPQETATQEEDQAESSAKAESSDEPASETDAAAAQPASVMDTTPWLANNPLTVDEDLIRHGKKHFEIYCSVCHGMNGGGNGLVNRRAQSLSQSTWIPPSKLSDPTLYADKYPDGKLFSTISNGIRKMPGYAGQIRPSDRWAIVAYVRALQKSQDASIDLVPAGQREAIRKRQEEVKQKLAEQAEAERKRQEERAQKSGQASS
ncbi:MAG: cytochrome c, partial [Pirellulales bacterium]|nr:cytochrome c [Pirellulales bacterium]